MNERSCLWTAVIVSAVILGLVWTKKDRQEGPSPNGWVPGQQQKQQQPATKGWPGYVQQAKESGKQLFVYFGRSDCQPCQKMKSEVLSNVRVQQALGKYIVCVFDVNQESALAQKFAVNVVPTMFIVDGDERVLKTSTGYMAADQFTNWLAVPVTPPPQGNPPGNTQPSPQQPHRKNSRLQPGNPGEGPVGPGCGPG